MFRLLVIVLAVVGGYVILQQVYPDVQRYLKLQSM